MNITQIEESVQKITKSLNKEEFIFDLLLAYGLPKSTITRLKTGDRNISKNEDEIHLKKKIFFKSTDKDIFKTFAEVKNDQTISKQSPRFILITDFKNLLALDTKNQDSLDSLVTELPKHFDFFLPLAGMEKKQHLNENPADVKAAERMAKLYDEIKKNNTIESEEEVHDLNVFLSRLLFCYFAEDTGIFEESQFVNAISSHTQQDGSDLNTYLDNLFEILNTENSKRKNLPKYLNDFPYVNGGLFRNKHAAPLFTRKSRQAIIEAAELDWKAIHPDIFGSMIQAVVKPDQRGGYGMHYTSVPNIMKVIEPLFLDELYEVFEASKNSEKKLRELLARIQKIKIFDPACGSGNFLIIAYKELRKLEMQIFQELKISMPVSSISLSNFYGIELDDFAHEIAILSLWLAEHQMDQDFFKTFGSAKPALPLSNAGNIIQGNATRLKWENICPKNQYDEIYVLGNPPYLGGKLQSKSQKEDTKIVFKDFKKYNNLDYIACWFYKSALYLTDDIKVAFVSTNSITQGTQVVDLWPHIFKLNIEIFFGYKDFAWGNNAKNQAGVYCSIIGIRKVSRAPKYIYDGSIKKLVSNINGYLIDAANIFVEKRTVALSKLPKMNQGNIPLESGHLRMNNAQKDQIVRQYPVSDSLFRKVIGSDELINDIKAWCLWITNENLNLAMSIEPIKECIQRVVDFRKNGAENAKACLGRPHQFCMTNVAENNQIVIPIVSSERREYIPIRYVSNEYIVINSALVIYDAPLYIFGLLNSHIHLLWVKTFAGKLETRLRYSVGLCWYSFPFPLINEDSREKITQKTQLLLKEREYCSGKTLGQIYNPDSMPENIKEAHKQLDLAVEQCYKNKPFENDEERLKYLFKLYEQMVEEEKNQGTLFEKPTKPKKRKKINA